MSTIEPNPNWTPSVLTAQDIDQMVEFLGSQEFRFSHNEKSNENLPTHNQPLRDDIQKFIKNWEDLRKTARRIFAQPSEVLTTQLKEVHISERYHLSPQAINRNLQEKCLIKKDNEWHILRETLWAEVEQSTLDTAENAYLVYVINLYHNRLQHLITLLEQEDEEYQFKSRQAEEQESQPRQHTFENIAQRAAKEKEVLQKLETIDIPKAWLDFSSLPKQETNRTKYDARYHKIAELKDSLDDLLVKGASLERREKIVHLGKRRPWEIYEFWMVAQVCKYLESLGFQPDPPSGFISLENQGGPRYGLQKGAQITYRHMCNDEINLTIRLSVQWEEQGKRPDLRLDLQDIEGPKYPLYLDAKCKKYDDFPDAQDDLEHSARRYAEKYEGTAFLLHPSKLRVWPSKKMIGYEHLSDNDFPFRHGIERLCIYKDHKTLKDNPLRLIFTAWLIRHGIFWICFQCGNSHRNRNGPDILQGSYTYKKIDFSKIYPFKPDKGRFGWICANPGCQCGIVLNRCHKCETIIVKSFSTKKSIDNDNQYWSAANEVYAQVPDDEKGTSRYCCDCGACFEKVKNRWG